MTTRHFLITGDYVLDNHIYQGHRNHYGDAASRGVHFVSQLGGAALVHSILEALLKKKAKTEKDEKIKKDTNNSDKPVIESEPEWKSWSVVEGSAQGQTLKGIKSAEQAYAYWRPYAVDEKKKSGPQFWRVSEAMGFGFIEGQAKCPVLPKRKLPEDPEIVIISEGGMGFRDCEDNWPKEYLKAAKLIVLKTTAPLAEGSLWQYLTNNYADKLIVIVSAWELRKSEARMSTGLSWEETVEGFFRELRPEGAFHALNQCRQLIVAFGSEGALWLKWGNSRKVAEATACLVHESGIIEGEHGHNTKGEAFGMLSCMAAAVSWALAANLDDPDMAEAVGRGLAAMRDLREQGHGQVIDDSLVTGFPSQRLAEVIEKTTLRYSRAWFLAKELKMLSGDVIPEWSLVQLAQGNSGPVYDLARLVLLRGPIAVESLPHLKIGNLLTADRREVESLRTLVQVIRRYENYDVGKKPLSIGVFGPPGAGKSFAVKEIANALVKDIAWLEFNLSQFASPDELNGAFHQIRDQVLQHRLPVAFFDEFDSQRFRWLQYLLAPMQDGKFQNGQLTHTLGKCIFVFAGGTSPTFETFGPPDPDRTKDSTTESEAQRDFRFAKGPDFKSRLDAFLNVLGPNPRWTVWSPDKGTEAEKFKFGDREFIVDLSDIIFPLRRALITRVQLRCSHDDKLSIDEGLVHALLHVKKYTHGNRSLEKILQPFKAAKPGRLNRSLLMPQIQLAMHTDDEEFIALCTGSPGPFLPKSPLTRDQIDLMAPAIHQAYRDKGKREGWLKPETDKDFNDLPDFFKESSRAAAERMLRLLALVGLTLADGDASEKEEWIIRQHLEYYLLGLAEAEHEGWMDWHLVQGWKHEKKKDDNKKHHNCLLPFAQLDDKNKSKDRDAIRMYPVFAREAGKKIILVREDR